jgi:hypothetical protein
MYAKEVRKMYESVEHNQARRALFDEIMTQVVEFNCENEGEELLGEVTDLAIGFAQRAFITTGVHHAVVMGDYPMYWVCARYNAIILRDLGYDTYWETEGGYSGERSRGTEVGETSGRGQTQPLNGDLVAENVTSG